MMSTYSNILEGIVAQQPSPQAGSEGDNEDSVVPRGFKHSMLVASVSFDFLSIARIWENDSFFRLSAPWLPST